MKDLLKQYLPDRKDQLLTLLEKRTDLAARHMYVKLLSDNDDERLFEILNGADNFLKNCVAHRWMHAGRVLARHSVEEVVALLTTLSATQRKQLAKGTARALIGNTEKADALHTALQLKYGELLGRYTAVGCSSKIINDSIADDMHPPNFLLRKRIRDIDIINIHAFGGSSREHVSPLLNAAINRHSNDSPNLYDDILEAYHPGKRTIHNLTRVFKHEVLAGTASFILNKNCTKSLTRDEILQTCKSLLRPDSSIVYWLKTSRSLIYWLKGNALYSVLIAMLHDVFGDAVYQNRYLASSEFVMYNAPPSEQRKFYDACSLEKDRSMVFYLADPDRVIENFTREVKTTVDTYTRAIMTKSLVKYCRRDDALLVRALDHIYTVHPNDDVSVIKSAICGTGVWKGMRLSAPAAELVDKMIRLLVARDPNPFTDAKFTLALFCHFDAKIRSGCEVDSVLTEAAVHYRIHSALGSTLKRIRVPSVWMVLKFLCRKANLDIVGEDHVTFSCVNYYTRKYSDSPTAILDESPRIIASLEGESEPGFEDLLDQIFRLLTLARKTGRDAELNPRLKQVVIRAMLDSKRILRRRQLITHLLEHDQEELLNQVENILNRGLTLGTPLVARLHRHITPGLAQKIRDFHVNTLQSVTCVRGESLALPSGVQTENVVAALEWLTFEPEEFFAQLEPYVPTKKLPYDYEDVAVQNLAAVHRRIPQLFIGFTGDVSQTLSTLRVYFDTYIQDANDAILRTAAELPRNQLVDLLHDLISNPHSGARMCGLYSGFMLQTKSESYEFTWKALDVLDPKALAYSALHMLLPRVDTAQQQAMIMRLTPHLHAAQFTKFLTHIAVQIRDFDADVTAWIATCGFQALQTVKGRSKESLRKTLFELPAKGLEQVDHVLFGAELQVFLSKWLVSSYFEENLLRLLSLVPVKSRVRNLRSACWTR